MLALSLPPSEPAAPAGLHAWRRWYTAFVARHELAWDLSLGGLALVFLAVGFLEDHPLAGLDSRLLAPVDGTITAIFIAEFAPRCYAPDARRQYVARHWIDLLALLPTIQALRVLRLGRLVFLQQAARVLRIGVLVRFLAQVDRVSKAGRGASPRDCSDDGLTLLLARAVLAAIAG